MRGEIIYCYFYDIADRIDLNRTKAHVEGAEAFSFEEHGKVVPEGVRPFELPLMLDLGEKSVEVNGADLHLQVQGVVYSVGAVAIRIRLPIDGYERESIDKITFSREFEDRFREISSCARSEMEKRLSGHVKVKERQIFETYRIYFLLGKASDFVRENRKWIAGILLGEQNYNDLSEEYTDSTLKRRLSYYAEDTMIADWDAAFIISESGMYENELMVIDTTNVQLLEYRIYQEEVDKMIDGVNERIKGIQRSLWNTLMTRRSMMKLSAEISSFYTEYKSMIDDVDKIIMSFGEWYLARLYAILSDSFKLKDIESRLEATFEMLTRIRDIIREQVSEDTSSFLELVVILLFVIEIILIVIPLVR